MAPPQVCIVLLNWNQETDTRECLASLQQCSYADKTIILVDNGSQDGSPQRLAREFPEVILLPQPVNLGFAEGSNVGIRAALAHGADQILLLNNDTLVDSAFLEPLAAALARDAGIGIVGPKIYCYPERETFWCAGGQVDWQTGRQFHRGGGEQERGQYESEVEIDYASGCCLLARRDVFEQIGLLDPRYFIYFEEADWCTRALSQGFRIRFIPTSRIWHKVSAAMQSSSPNTAYYITRNRLLFLTEHGPRERQAFFRYFYTTRSLWYGLRLLVSGQRAQGWAVLQGVWDFHRGRFGQRRVIS